MDLVIHSCVFMCILFDVFLLDIGSETDDSLPNSEDKLREELKHDNDITNGEIEYRLALKKNVKLSIIDDMIKDIDSESDLDGSEANSLDSEWSHTYFNRIDLKLREIYGILINKNVKNRKTRNSGKDIIVKMEDINKIRNESIYEYYSGYKLISNIVIRNVDEYKENSILKMKEEGISTKMFRRRNLIESMLKWQKNGIYSSLTKGKSRNIDVKLNSIAPNMFRDLQIWMKDFDNNDKGYDICDEMFDWIEQLIQKEGNDLELCKRFTNEMFIQISKQLMGNPSELSQLYLGNELRFTNFGI